jgi:hypothetical protein
MSERINLVQGDNRPYIKLTLTGSDGQPIDLSDANTTVAIHFRSVEADEVLTTLSATKLNSGTDGVVIFNFPGNTLEVKPGIYEGEVEIQFGAETQTLYERLSFYVREKF